ncbi:peroxiredoxin family protein, partial [Ancylomarina sp. YFZ004]
MKQTLTILFVLIATTCYNSMAQSNVFVEEINKYENEKIIYELFTKQVVDMSEKEVFVRSESRRLRNNGNEKSFEKNYKNLNTIISKKKEFYKGFIEKNKNTLTGALALINVIDRSDCSGIHSEREIIALGKKFKEIPNGVVKEYLENKINILKHLQIGGICPLIRQEDPKGNMISTSDFKGNYLIIDFWSSWCCGCRQESPNIKKIYKEFKPSGLEVLGVSLDTKKDKWIKAVKDDDLPWTQ